MPAPLRFSTIADAVADYENEVSGFIKYYKPDPEKIVTNPFFGDLNFEEWLHLLQKHATHHLKQYNLA